MSSCPDELELEAFVDGEDPASHAKILCHIEECSVCRKKVEDLRALNSLIRKVEHQHVAPRTLVDRLRQESVARNSRRPNINRRFFLGGAAAAAAVGGVFVADRFWRGRKHDLQSTLFGDFRTLVAADKQLDFQSDNTSDLIAWFTPRVPFELPRLASVEPLELRGGRLCWLASRRFAAVDFNASGGTVCLYICGSKDLRINPNTPLPNDGSDTFVTTEAGISGAFWQQDGVAMSLVGNPSAADMLSIADQIRRGIQQRTALL